MIKTSQSKTIKLPQIHNKRYFTIGEVAFLCAVKPHVLRYWEQEFPQLRPAKRRGNRRYYQREDVITVRHIRGLLYDEGYTIIGARIQLDQVLNKSKQPVNPNPINFEVEPESNNDDELLSSLDLKAIMPSHDNLNSNSNINQNTPQYCSLTELEYLAGQLKSEQVKTHVAQTKHYKMSIDEIIFELRDILSELEDSRMIAEISF